MMKQIARRKRVFECRMAIVATLGNALEDPLESSGAASGSTDQHAVWGCTVLGFGALLIFFIVGVFRARRRSKAG